MHDHVIDGMLQFDRKGLTPRALRLHLDNSHDSRTSGWDFDALDRLHHKLHASEADRLAEIEAAANLVAEGLAAAPAAVVESDSRLHLHLKEAREKLCRAQMLISDCGALGRHARGNLGRAIDLIDAVGAEWCDQWSRFDQPPPVDVLEATKASLAASHLSDSPAEVEPRPAGRTTSAGAPRSEAS